MTQPGAPRAIILDRDGTIVVDHGYLADPARLCFLPRAAEGLRIMRAHGHPLIVVTNQSGVARGRLTLERMHEVNDRLMRMLEAAGARLEGIYSCPHGPDEGCDCRKPNVGLVLAAAAAHGFDPARSIVIGDKGSDIELGQRLQSITMLVSQDGGASDAIRVEPDYVVRDLLEASRIIGNLEAGSGPADRNSYPV